MTTMTDRVDMKCSIADETNYSVSSGNGRRYAITAPSGPSSLAYINIVEKLGSCNAMGDSSVPSDKISTMERTRHDLLEQGKTVKSPS